MACYRLNFTFTYDSYHNDRLHLNGTNRLVFLTDIDCVPCKILTQFCVGCDLHDTLQQAKDLLRVTYEEENVGQI